MHRALLLEMAASAFGDREAVVWTSGATGAPKAALLRHRHLGAYVFGSVEFGSAGPEKATLVAVPPYHVAGIAAILSSVYAGRRLVQLSGFDAEGWIDTAEAERVTHAFVVPTTNADGLPETSSTIALPGPDEHRAAQASRDPAVRRRLGSVDRPLPGIEVAIRLPGGGWAATGEPGEVWVRGDQVAGEYLASGRRDEGGWFPTRDAGWLCDALPYTETGNLLRRRLREALAGAGERP